MVLCEPHDRSGRTHKASVRVIGLSLPLDGTAWYTLHPKKDDIFVINLDKHLSRFIAKMSFFLGRKKYI
jgi:hypothetical protein